MRHFLIKLVLLLVPCYVSAQDQTNFTQFYLNPYLLNPSYAGTEGQSALFLVYRNQWAGIEGAPRISGLSYHTLFNNNLSFGFNAFNDQRGILNTSSGALTFGYTLSLSKKNFIRFGMSAGMASNGLDISQIENLNDPALFNILERNNTLIGNAGISFHLNTFHLGVSLPSIFEPVFVSIDPINITEVAPFESIIINASNRFYFAKDKHIFEPYLVYRYGGVLPSQIEAAAVMHLNHVVWFGGSYKQDFGVSALGGIKLNKVFLLGYSYAIANTGINEISSPTHEIQLALLLGKRKQGKPVYSFVNTVKEKEKKKTPQQIAAEKRKAEEEARRKEEALALQRELDEKKAEQERQKREEAARAAEEQRLEQQRQAEAQRLAQEQAAREQRQAADRTAAERQQQQADAERRQREEAQRLLQEEEARQRAQQAEAERRRREEELRRRQALEAQEAAERKAREEAAERAKQELQARAQPERHETVKRGSHLLELPVGNYVIIGAFGVFDNAVRYADNLHSRGYNTKYGFLSFKGLYYVYLFVSDDINEARKERDNFRRNVIFKDAWLLTVE